jgi:hypothetical protein
MNWHYDNPIVNKQYICCVKGDSRRKPITLDWYNGEWGTWSDGIGQGWLPLDTKQVVCYIGFDEIPMPEGW